MLLAWPYERGSPGPVAPPRSWQGGEGAGEALASYKQCWFLPAVKAWDLQGESWGPARQPFSDFTNRGRD